MKKIILLLIMSIPIYCLSQNWAEYNSVWHYDQIDYGPPFNHDYIKFSIIGDTVILGDTARIIKEEYVTIYDTASAEIFIKSDSNRVYLFVSSLNSYELIYDFNALLGDTIQVYCRDAFQDSTIKIVVDSISTIDINGNTMNVQYVSQPYTEEFYMHGTIIENIGWTGFMFPIHSWADPPYGGQLRCFENDIIGLYKLVSFDCDYITTIESIKIDNSVRIFPNPSYGKFSIQAENIEKVEINDINGKCILIGKKTEIDLANYKQGIYVVKVTTKDRTVIEKIVLK